MPTLPESTNYITKVGYSEEFKRDVYQVVNRTTNVIEFETPVFGYVHSSMKGLEEVYNGIPEPVMPTFGKGH